MVCDQDVASKKAQNNPCRMKEENYSFSEPRILKMMEENEDDYVFSDP